SPPIYLLHVPQFFSLSSQSAICPTKKSQALSSSLRILSPKSFISLFCPSVVPLLLSSPLVPAESPHVGRISVGAAVIVLAVAPARLARRAATASYTRRAWLPLRVVPVVMFGTLQ